jgi:hypothetical protein
MWVVFCSYMEEWPSMFKCFYTEKAAKQCKLLRSVVMHLIRSETTAIGAGYWHWGNGAKALVEGV